MVPTCLPSTDGIRTISDGPSDLKNAECQRVKRWSSACDGYQDVRQLSRPGVHALVTGGDLSAMRPRQAGDEALLHVRLDRAVVGGHDVRGRQTQGEERGQPPG